MLGKRTMGTRKHRKLNTASERKSYYCNELTWNYFQRDSGEKERQSPAANENIVEKKKVKTEKRDR